MKLKGLLHLIILIWFIVISCNNKQQPVADAQEKNDPASSIDISEVKTELPQAGNVALIEANCTPCHSLRYIEMQPELTHKAWEKTVDKMITAFGAPVRDSVTRKDIIEYLYAIRGKKG
jgi:hypothetical protein